MKKCKECKVKESQLLSLSSKYQGLMRMAMTGRSIHDLDRTIGENRIIEAFRSAGCFSPVGEVEPHGLIAGGIVQSFDVKKAIEVLENFKLNR